MKHKVLHTAVAMALTVPLAAVSVSAKSGSQISLNSQLTEMESLTNLNHHRIPTINQLQSNSVSLVDATTTQLSAINSFKQSHPSAQIKLNAATGTIDSLHGISIDAQGTTPEQIAKSFLRDHASLFEGLTIEQLTLNSNKTRSALGGELVRFDQTIDGITVLNRGLGVVIDGNNNIRAVMGPYQKDINLSTEPGLSSAAAVSSAQNDLLDYRRNLSAEALTTLQPAYDLIGDKLGVFKSPVPELAIVQTDNGSRLAWQFIYYSQNPFGVFKYAIDANTGDVLYRVDQVRTAEESEPTDQFADYFPTFPPITTALQNDCAIVDANGGETGRPLGMERIKLRKFDDSNRATGANGTLTGTHAHIENALPTKLPFAQAAAGTYYFGEENQPVEGRPDERNHLSEPAEHIDGISQFIYITSLLEYLDYMHKEGDAVHSRGIGSGSFPDQYPNESVPLLGVVHIPNVLAPPEDTSDPEFIPKLLGLDNAFAVPLSQEIAGQEVVVNPTFYGHGYVFNDLAVDFSVPIHEGTHATITPIAGFEGSPEGPALNEGQADLWAYTIGETPDLGTYPVNSCDLRDLIASSGGDPDSFEFIRSGQSQLRYSQLGTRDNTFEEHRDGEIYAGAMWDLREIMTSMYPEQQFNRPNAITGEPTDPASLGKEIWERVFLGSMYVLGVSAPDTFVKTRDATLIADALLYPENPVDINSKGQHHALIERVFAAREIGINAEAPLGGVQVISSAMSAFTANQPAPATPQNVVADIVDQDTINVSWDKVDNALGYQILKRKGNNPARLFAGVEGREYIDGDASFSGYTHVEFVTGADTTQYNDKGQGFGRGAGQGIEALDFQYVVRAFAFNSNNQVGFSDLSGTAKTALAREDVTDQFDTDISNVSFTGGQFAFDQHLNNISLDDVFGPIHFDIVSISSNNVTASNADNGGSGQSGDSARYTYDESVAAGASSSTRYLSFNNPMSELFTFKAIISGQLEGQAIPATGNQAATDTSEATEREVVYHNIEQRTGLVVIGTTDQYLVDGIDYVDVNFTALDSAKNVVATLSADPDVGGAYPDLDFELRDSDGNIMATSGNLGPNEQVGGVIVPGETYTLRVVGWANGPTQYTVIIDQTVTDSADANDGSNNESSTALDGVMMEFMVNPLTGEVTSQML